MKLLLLIILLPFMALSQGIQEKLVFTDQPDSAFIQSNGGHNFDKEGNYCFEFKKGDKEYYALTKKGTIGPFKSTSASFSGKGSVSFLYNSYDSEKEFYYKNTKGITFYGPVFGKVERQITENSRERVALTVSKKDSLYFYLDDRLVATQLKNKNNLVETDDWCTFSRNGHCLYYVPKDGLYFLYLDHTPIATSLHRFAELHIVNSGAFVYAKGERPKIKGTYDFQFFIHTRDTTIGPVRTVWKNFLNDDGSYYFSGDDNGPDYIAVNNTLYKNVENVANVLLPDPHHYFFTFIDSGAHRMNADGRIYTYGEYPTLLYPTMDAKGNFSFFRVKDYYLYACTNGRQATRPISRYGVRGVPLYINATGSSVHYFQTDDSTYLYRDEEPLLPPVANTRHFSVLPWNEVISAYPPREKPAGHNQLSFFSFDSTGYFLFNGVLSRPMENVQHQSISRSNETGRVVMGELTDEGFFVVQKTGNKKFAININNATYTTLDGIDKIDSDDYFFDGRELILYALKGLSYYRYTITL